MESTDKSYILMNFITKVNEKIMAKESEIKERLDKTPRSRPDWLIDNAQLVGMDRVQSMLIDVFIKEFENESSN